MKLILSAFILLFALSFTAFAQTESERDKGIEFYMQGEYEKATEILQNRVKAENKDRLSWAFLGASFVKLKKYNDAVKAFQKADGGSKKNLPIYDKELKIIKNPLPSYSKRAANNQTSGLIKVAIEFGADGKIGMVFPFQILSDGLTEKAVNAAKSIEFEPAVKDGKPVAVIKTVHYSFDIF